MSRRWLPTCVGLLGVIFGVASCKGESEEPNPPATPYQKFVGAYVDEFCVALEPCCSSIPFDVATCQEFYGLSYGFQAASADPKLFTFHQDRADQCLSDLRSSGVCSGTAPPSCSLVTEGTQGPGAACHFPEECTPSNGKLVNCELDIDGNGGHCAYPASSGALGEACTSDCPPEFEPCAGDVPNVQCYPSMGLHCLNGACQPLAAVGAPCSGFDSCVDAATCNGGTCVARVGPGAACVVTEDCAQGNYCPAGVCAAQLPAGSPCGQGGFSDECLGGLCGDAGRCMDLGLEVLCGLGALE